jgi:hypothetical protein
MSSSAPPAPRSALARLGSFAAVSLAIAFTYTALAAPVAGCNYLDGGDDDSDAASTCNGATCSSTQFCLYRACTAAESCLSSTESSCPAGYVSADCNGEPGCMNEDCAPVAVGCTTYPAACGSDITCACASVCGGASLCASASAGVVTCSASS